MGSKRFEDIYIQESLQTFRIIRDNETGALHMGNYSGAGGGFKKKIRDLFVEVIELTKQLSLIIVFRLVQQSGAFL
jgi:hypothetical protein